MSLSIVTSEDWLGVRGHGGHIYSDHIVGFFVCVLWNCHRAQNGYPHAHIALAR